MKKDLCQDLFVPIFARCGSPLVRGKGVYLYDASGKQFLDFGSGIAVNALGHSHPALVKTIQQQATKLIHTSNLYCIKTQIELAALLVRHSFGDRVFLCNSGTEAIEASIKFARKWAGAQDAGRHHILSFFQGFHGRTYGAMSATAQTKFHEGFGPIMPGCHYASLNDIPAVQALLAKHKFAAIIIEPLQGEGGIHQASTEFLTFLRKQATALGIALIFDEIQCGMGRTGTLWHYEQHNVIPDIMAIAKPLGGGLPLGGVICTNEIALSMTVGSHGSTFGGNPLACAVGCTLFKIVSRKTFLNEVKSKGDYCRKLLTECSAISPLVKEVRGAGLLNGIELCIDPKKVVEKCKEKGLLLIKAESNTVRFLPPLTVERSHIDKAVEIFASVLKKCN